MKVVFWTAIIISIGVVSAFSICKPELLASNYFLKNFINHEILNILALIMTVTSASVANIHIALNRAEEATGQKDAFVDARKEINGSAFGLIWIFVFSVLLLVVRSEFLDDLYLLSFFNGFALVLLLVNVLVLIDITSAIFELHPFFSNHES